MGEQYSHFSVGMGAAFSCTVDVLDKISFAIDLRSMGALLVGSRMASIDLFFVGYFCPGEFFLYCLGNGFSVFPGVDHRCIFLCLRLFLFARFCDLDLEISSPFSVASFFWSAPRRRWAARGRR